MIDSLKRMQTLNGETFTIISKTVYLCRCGALKNFCCPDWFFYSFVELRNDNTGKIYEMNYETLNNKLKDGTIRSL